MLAQLLANGIIAGCATALVAFGFALIYNTTRTFHFAHGAVYISSFYLFYSLHQLTAPIWLCIALVLPLSALLGVAIDELVYRPLIQRNSSSLVRLLSSLGVYIIIVNAIPMFWGNEVKVFSTTLQPTVSFDRITLSRIQVITAGSCFVIFAALAFLLRMTRLGKLFRAMRDDPDLLSTLGVNPRNVRAYAFALGSLLAGLAAILKGLDVGIDPNSGMAVFLSAAIAVIIAGIGIFEGVILASLLVAVLQSIAIWKLSAQWQDMTTFILLILFLLVRPQGVFGSRKRMEELAG